MNERTVPLPGGGSATITRAPSHAQAATLRRHRLRLARFTGPTRDAEGNQVQDWRIDLTAEELDAKDDLIVETEAVHIRALVRGWQGVTSADGDPLIFPDDLAQMRERDFQALFLAVTAAEDDTEEDGADPNVARPPSGSTSRKESSPLTPVSAST